LAAFSLAFTRRGRVLDSVVVFVVFVMKLLIFLVYFLANKTADTKAALIHTDFY